MVLCQSALAKLGNWRGYAGVNVEWTGARKLQAPASNGPVSPLDDQPPPCPAGQLLCTVSNFSVLPVIFRQALITSSCVQSAAACSCAAGVNVDSTAVQVDSKTLVCPPAGSTAELQKAACNIGDATQKFCATNSYDETGMLLWPPETSCVPATQSCPCDSQNEQQCSVAPYSYCVMTGQGCPNSGNVSTTLPFPGGPPPPGGPSPPGGPPPPGGVPPRFNLSSWQPELVWPLSDRGTACPAGQLICSVSNYSVLPVVPFQAMVSISCVESVAACVCPSGAGLDNTAVQVDNKTVVCPPDGSTADLQKAACDIGDATQKFCTTNSYDDTGMLMWPPQLSCVPAYQGCPCDIENELQCSVDPYSYCITNDKDCPNPPHVTPAMLAGDPSYLVNLVLSWTEFPQPNCSSFSCFNAGFNPQLGVVNGSWQCVTNPAQCTCGAGAQAQACQSGDNLLICAPLQFNNGTCPVNCNSTQTACNILQYDKTGMPLMDGMDNPILQTQCVAGVNANCPCNSQWESTCSYMGMTYCQPTSAGSCPVDCGNMDTCYHMNSTDFWTTCATSSGCTCNPAYGEIACTDPMNASATACFSTMYYSQCPLVCTDPTTGECPVYYFDQYGMLNQNQTCSPLLSTGDCPTLCDNATASVCGDPSTPWLQYCAPQGQCPPTCSASQQLCFGQNNATVGTMNDLGTCMDASMPCPCMVNQQTCLDSTGSPYCSYDPCPTFCSASQITCPATGFSLDGSLDPATAFLTTCVNPGQNCTCGNNGMFCNWTDSSGYQNMMCMPKTVNGVVESCPVSCTSTQQPCYLVDYSTVNGTYIGSRQTCVDLNATCGCGAGSQLCGPDDNGNMMCMPKMTLDATGTAVPQTCPVYCNSNTQDTCNVPNFDISDPQNPVILSIDTSCVPTGTPCNCKKGKNAKACTFSVDGVSYTDCIPTNAYCPAACPAGQVACPMVTNYNPDGTHASTVQPNSGCAASATACGCGLQAQMCTFKGEVFCYPSAQQCPMDCADGQELCTKVDYDVLGNATKTTNVCVNASNPCPCGLNSDVCPGQGVCVSKASMATICPCTASQDVCFQENFDPTTGATLSKSPVCVVKGAICPCGKGARTCPDPNDATNNICVPQSAPCDTPCTPAQQAMNMSTCVQTNLADDGTYKSKTVTCRTNGQCNPGTNMKQCPSGSIIYSGAVCEDLYGQTSGPANPKVGAPDGISQSSSLSFSLNPGANATAQSVAQSSNTIESAIATALQLPPTITLDVVLVPVSSGGRRLQANSQAKPAAVKVVATAKNPGKSAVSPAVAMSQASKMVKTGNPSMAKALSAAGSVNQKQGVSSATVSTKVQSRATQVQVAKATALAATTAPTTTAPPTATTVAAAGGTTQVVTATTPVPAIGKQATNGGSRAAPLAVVLTVLALMKLV